MKNAKYKKLFKDNYPDIKIDEFIYINGGVDFYTFCINNSIILKFPVSIEISKRIPFEVSLMKKLENKLEIEIPNLIYNSKVQNQNAFIGYNKIQGVPFDVKGSAKSIEISLQLLNNVIRDLALIENRNIETKQIHNNWKTNYSFLLEGITLKAFKFIDNSISKSVEEIINQNNEKFIRNNFSPKLIHSDLKSSHLICNNDNIIIGLIDWSDAIYGDISFEFARILTELGFDIYVRLLEKRERFLSDYDTQRIAYYSILIPFNRILNGINNRNNKLIQEGVNKLIINLNNYDKVQTKQ